MNFQVLPLRESGATPKHPVVELVTTTYQTGIKLTKEEMDVLETQFQRLPSLEKWFVDIPYVPRQEVGIVNNS